MKRCAQCGGGHLPDWEFAAAATVTPDQGTAVGEAATRRIQFPSYETRIGRRVVSFNRQNQNVFVVVSRRFVPCVRPARGA